MNGAKQQAAEEVEIDFDGLILDLSESLDETIDTPADSKIDASVENVAQDARGTEIAERPQMAPEPARTETERLTVHTHGRLAALASMNDARAVSQRNLDMISEAISGIFAANEMSRQFLDASHADIKRANRLEVDNAGLAGECHRLAAEVDRLRKQCERHATHVEVQRAREEKFVQAAGKLRENLHAAKLGLAEATNLLTASETRQVELQAELLAKGNLIDLLTRETDMLRGRLSSMTLEMDNASRKLAEMRRQHDELQAVHAESLGNHAETAIKLASADSEASRLQKLTDVLEARLADAESALNDAAIEADERESRYQNEVRVLRQENQALNSRLCAKTAEQLDTVGENRILKSRIEDLAAERQSADRQATVVPLQIAYDQVSARDTPILDEASTESETAEAQESPSAQDETRARKDKKGAAVARSGKQDGLTRAHAV